MGQGSFDAFVPHSREPETEMNPNQLLTCIWGPSQELSFDGLQSARQGVVGKFGIILF